MKLALRHRMSEYARNVRASELSLVDAPPAPAPDPVAPADAHAERAAPAPSAHAEHALPVPSAHIERAVPAPSEARFLAKARQEHAAGQVDPSLWARALAQAGDDPAQATRIYVNMRATALRVAKRNEKAAKRELVVEKLRSAPEIDWGAKPAGAPKTSDETASKEPDRKHHSGANPKRRRMIALAAAAGCAVVVSGLIALRLGSDSASSDEGAKPASAAGASQRGMPPVRAGGVTQSEASAVENNSAEEIVGKVQALEKAGNWHLLAIYAAEWTRKQPANPNAWKQLSQAYARLRQFNEAVDAATKATEVAPEDWLTWQNLGQVNLAVPRFAQALAAFQKATTLNDQDVVSLTQVGVLNAQLGNLPDARIAFDKALAASPEDVPALCGAASLAQKEGRVKDAEAMTRKLASLYSVCPEPPARESVRVIASDPAPTKPKAAPVRR